MFNSYLFRVVLIPAGVFVSVMFAGGASTGLEIAAYMTSNGPVGGLVAIALIATIYTLVIFLCYELARIYRCYDYQSFSRIILGGRLYLAYEISITLAMFGVMAYSTTGGGTALADFFDVSRYLVTGIILATVIFLTYQGRRLVEITMVATTILLISTALWLAIGTINMHGIEISRQLGNTEINIAGLGKKVGIYSVAVMAYIPILLYAARDLKTRSEVLVAALTSSLIISLPPLCMHLAYLSHYPEVLDQAIPNAWIAEQVMPGFFNGFFVIVLNIVILQTAVGILQGLIERIDNWKMQSSGVQLGKKAHAGISTFCLIACLGLSTFGVQRLLGWMYDIAFWLFLVFFFLPLIIVGSYRIYTKPAVIANSSSVEV